jgi:hypothetical protein
MTVRQVVSGAILLVALVLVPLAIVNGLTELYVVGGAMLVIALFVLLYSLGSTRPRRWALSSITLVAVAALIATPIHLNTSHNPVIDYAPENDARWLPDSDGAGYVVTKSSIQRLDGSGHVDWEQPAEGGVWSTPDGVIARDKGDLTLITASGDVAWKRTALDLGKERLEPVAWSGGVTTISACTSSPGDVAGPRCRYVGIDAAGQEAYSLEGWGGKSMYAGGIFYFRNFASSVEANGDLPRYFARSASDDADVYAPNLLVADAADAQTVASVPAFGNNTGFPAFVGDRVLTRSVSGDVCSVSAVPIADDPGWSREVPCLEDSGSSGTVSSLPNFQTGLLDGETIWSPTHADYQADTDALAIDIETGETAPAGKVLWGLNEADAAEAAVAAGGLVLQARGGALTAHDPFSDTTPWTAPLQGTFESAYASSGVLAVVTKPARPRLFASGDNSDLTVYALDDGRVLGQQRFDSHHSAHVLPLDDAALLVLDDGTSIRVGD